MSIIGNPIILGGGRSGDGIIIPSTYQRIEYVAIESSGPYIDLGLVPTNHSVYADIMVVTYVGNASLFGTNADNKYFHMSEYSNKWYWGTNNSEKNSGTVAASTGNRYSIKYNIGNDYSVYVNGFLLGSGTQITTTADKNLCIAKRASKMGYNLRYYSFDVIDKSTEIIVRNLIPVYRKSDNVVGFWDTVNNYFYINTGTGTFTAGPDIT